MYGYLYNYSLDGTLLGTVELDEPGAYGNGLALDPADDTFWFFSWSNERLEQYSRGGVLLDSVAGMERIYGGEFHHPRVFSDGFESGDVSAWSGWVPFCSENTDCDESEFCKKNGCDGATYSNQCYAHLFGVNVAYPGECSPWNLRCPNCSEGLGGTHLKFRSNAVTYLVLGGVPRPNHTWTQLATAAAFPPSTAPCKCLTSCGKPSVPSRATGGPAVPSRNPAQG